MIIKSGIYQIKNNVTNQRYIGSAVDLINRKQCHFSELRKDKHPNSHLQRAYNKYGPESFGFQILEYCNKDDLIVYEQIWINKFDFKLLYNLRKVAYSNKGLIFSDEVRSKMSAAQKKSGNRPPDKKGTEHPWYGRKLSEEHKNKITDSSVVRQKSYSFLNPGGKPVTVVNLCKFCKDNDLNKGNMSLVFFRKRKQHKGWTYID